MESEKVKEIKIVLKGLVDDASKRRQNVMICGVNLADILTLINELESENERLTKELDSEWKDRRKAEEDLHKAQWNYKIGLGQSKSVNKKLKDRIAELEEYIKGNEQDAKAFVNGWHKDLETALKHFAERLKEKTRVIVDFYKDHADKCFNGISEKEIDETLKEFLK